jgi:hypothetical protein
VLGVAHYGKSLDAGTSGSLNKENSSDVVLACLGLRELSGSIVNSRLAIRKNRAGPQGQEHPFSLRLIEMGLDEDGEPTKTMVVDWSPPGTAPEPLAPDDPWGKPKRQDQRTAVLRLKRVLMAIMAEQGVDLPAEPDGPAIRMVDQRLVREAFFIATPAEGDTQRQKDEFRRKRFVRALDWAEDEELIGVGEINEVTYLWLRPRTQVEEDPEG